MKKTLVTKSFLPDIKKYKNYVDQIWNNCHLTNQGPFTVELEGRLNQYLDTDHLLVLSNGTIALQLALKALDITAGEIITTPFSYVATLSSILWERCTPVFADIDPETFCIDPNGIERLVTPATKAIMAVHVFGYPCDTDALAQIADTHGLKIIYDAAHAFGASYKGRSLLDYGDISTCSFHATKIFHTIEGGCVVVRDKTVFDHLKLMKSFGHDGDDHYCLGINAKMSEFQAIMGLCNIDELPGIIARRKKVTDLYDALLAGIIMRPRMPDDFIYNYAYYAAVFQDEATCLRVIQSLNAQNIYPRRYFYPSLNTLPYLDGTASCPVSEDISSRILCLPLYVDLPEDTIRRTADIIRAACS